MSERYPSLESNSKSRRAIYSRKWRLLSRLASICILSFIALHLSLSYHQPLHSIHVEFNPDHVKHLPIPIEEDILHLTYQYDACMTYKESVILGSCKQPNINDSSCLFDQTDPYLVQKIASCPLVDVYLPSSIRIPGYCQDAVAYNKFLNSRLLPQWVFEMQMTSPSGTNVTYFDLCPDTPVIIMNHYHDDIFDLPEWKALGKRKPVYLMPNIEMYELRYEDFTRSEVILCKTRICYDRVSQLFQQEGNPNNSIVMYTKHTSTDPSTLSPDPNNTRLVNVANKDMYFIHTVGTSVWKGTAAVMDCWLSRLDLPPLHLYIQKDNYNYFYSALEQEPLYYESSMQIHTNTLTNTDYANLLRQAPVILCPSLMEGYGHYINQARASESLIVSTDLAPMNELITPDTGVLANIEPTLDPDQFLGGIFDGPHALRNVTGMRGELTGDDVCNAVDNILNMTVSARMSKARAAKQAYLDDTRFFRRKMNELKALVVLKRMERLSR